MKNSIYKTYLVAFFTLKEVLKSKILVSVLIIGLTLVLVTFVAYNFTYGDPGRVALDFGLGALSLSSVAIAIFIGSGILSKEIENRTVYMIISRPVERSSFIIGRILGLGIVVAINVFLLSILTLFIYKVTGGVFDNLMYWTIFFVGAEAIIMLLIVSLFSLITTQTLSIIFSIVVFISGHAINSAKFTTFGKDNPVFKILIDGYQYILPALYKINLKDYVLYKQHVDTEQLINMLLYSISYSLMILVLSSIIFNKKNLD